MMSEQSSRRRYPPQTEAKNQANRATQQAGQAERFAGEARAAAATRRDQRQLDAYVRAQGSMSVARRHEVQLALEDLGYRRAEARQISLDVRLNASMSDEQATGEALLYAAQLDTPRAGLVGQGY